MIRQALANLLTLSLTVSILGGIALFEASQPERAARPGTDELLGDVSTAPFEQQGSDEPSESSFSPAPGLETYVRLAGVVTDPWHVDEWSAAVGERFDIAMNFSAWSKRRDPTAAFEEAARRGVIPMVTWEPWKPPPTGLPGELQGRLQPAYSNVAIAAGRQDHYIRRFARACAAHPGPVFLRYAHEMMGFWYPWSINHRAYVRAWRHVHNLFQQEGADNVVFVWSVNPSLYIRSAEQWRRMAMRYWPGERYVDWVGATMLDFGVAGGFKDYSVRRLAARISNLRRLGKPTMLTEVNVNFEDRLLWLRALRRWLSSAPWVRALVWSQAFSRGQAAMPGIGNMNWSVLDDHPSARLLGSVIREGHRKRPSRRRGPPPRTR